MESTHIYGSCSTHTTWEIIAQLISVPSLVTAVDHEHILFIPCHQTFSVSSTLVQHPCTLSTHLFTERGHEAGAGIMSGLRTVSGQEQSVHPLWLSSACRFSASCSPVHHRASTAQHASLYNHLTLLLLAAPCWGGRGAAACCDCCQLDIEVREAVVGRGGGEAATGNQHRHYPLKGVGIVSRAIFIKLNIFVAVV